MSKFFSDIRMAGVSPGVDSVMIDSEGAIALLNGAKDSGSNVGKEKRETTGVLSALRPVDQLGGAANERLAGCRTIRLPRSERSLLLAQCSPTEETAIEGYRILRTRLDKRQSKTGMRSLVISSATQGEGKTLTAFNLFLCYAKTQRLPLLIVDADLRSRGLSRLLEEPESPGLSKILEGECEYSSAILGTDFPGLYVLPSGSSSSSSSELFSGPHWKQFVAWATETFQLVIVDCPPVLNVADFDLVMAPCDSAVLVVRSRKTAAVYLSEVLAQIDTHKMAGVVFNATEEPIVGYYPTM